MTVSWGSVGPRRVVTLLGSTPEPSSLPSRSVQLLPGLWGHCPFLQVISGQQLPKVANSKDGAIIDPLVRVEIHGVPADQARQETKYIENNGEAHGGTRDPAVPKRSCPCSPSPSQQLLSLPRV